MKYATYILAAALLACSFAFSSEDTDNTNQVALPHHRLYVGPDILFGRMRMKTNFWDNRIDDVSNEVLGGPRIGYDYLKPRSFYFGTYGLIAIGRVWFRENVRFGWSYGGPHSMIYRTKGSVIFSNIEQRYGYTFQSPISARSTFVPYAAVGWFYNRARYAGTSCASWVYGAAGLMVDQQFCDNFDVGFKVKAMCTIAGKARQRTESGSSKHQIRHVWGYEVDLPFTCYVGSSKRWDVQFEPYLLKLNIYEPSQFFGIRLLAGYSF